MVGKSSKIEKKWYSPELPGIHNLIVWISIGISMLVCIFDLLRWVFKFRITGDQWFPMPIITILCVILAFAAIIIQKTNVHPRIRKIIPVAIIIFIGTVSVLTLFTGLLNTKQELEYFLAPDQRMTELTACLLLTISMMIWLMQIGKTDLTHLVNIPVALIGYFYLISYILGIYSDMENHLTPLEFTASIAISAFCITVFLRNPKTWLIRVFVSGHSGGIIARQLLLPLSILPIIIGWLRITGEHHGYFNSEVGVVLVALTYTFCFFMLTWVSARSIDRIDRKRLESEEASFRSHNRMQLLSEIASRLLVSDDPQKIVNELCNEIKDFLDCQVFLNYLANDASDKLHLNAWAGIPAHEAKKIEWLDFATSVSGCVAGNGEPVLAESIQESIVPGMDLVRSFGINAYACHPLMSHEKIIGTLSFGSRNRSKFNEEDISLMKIVSDQVAIAMGRMQNEKALRESNRMLNALEKSSQVMMHTHNELKYLLEVCKIIIEDCGYLLVWIGYARNDSKKTVEPVAYYGFDKGYIDQLAVTWDDSERGNGPTGTAIKTGKPVICRNMLTDPDFEPWREQALRRGYASSIVLPLMIDRKAFGAISIYAKEPDAFSSIDVDLLENLANDLAYGISNIRLTESERNAAKTIKESEEKYRLLFDEMIEGFALHEMLLDDHGLPFDYRFISVNPAFEKQTGLKAADVIGKTAREVLPSTESYWIQNYGKVALEGKSIDFENYSSDLNSYFKVSAFSPRKGYFAVIFENITKRILSEKELQNTKNYLENLINYANAPIIVWNSNTEIQLFNHAFEHLTGYKSSEVLGLKLDILFPEASLSDSNVKITTALTKNWETIEIPILTKNKRIRTVLWNSANVYDTDNQTILSTIAQGHDISERIAAEKEVRTSKEKLDLALDNANIGIWTWDIKSNLFEWDERIGSMLGLDRTPVQSNFEEFEKCIYEEDVSHFNRAIYKTLEDDIPFDTIFRIRLGNGEFRHIDAKARVEKDAQGKAVKMTGVCLDITAMKKTTEKTMFNLNEDLLRSNRELEQFAYVASHDLQEPLRMVSSFTQLLSTRYKDKLDQQAQEFISFAVDGAQRMQRLINDLLQYSRINTRGKSLSLINVNDILKQTLHNLGLKIKEKKAVITNNKLPEVVADDSQMMQLFQNLIENGIKFCDKKPRVHISATEHENHFVFSVHDNGIGIEPQYFERIFQIFQRLHLKDEYGGTGIGLAICKRIVERHGGKIWVESLKDKGTTFKFSIRKI